MTNAGGTFDRAAPIGSQCAQCGEPALWTANLRRWWEHAKLTERFAFCSMRCERAFAQLREDTAGELWPG